jgi:hypothetical protein
MSTDFEAYLRTLPPEQIHVLAKINAEGRVEMHIQSDPSRTFVVVEDKVICPAAEEAKHGKPPTQGVLIEGFDAYKGMGSR